MNNIEERIKKIISEVVEIEILEIDSLSHFVDDLGIDSLDSVEIVVRIEKEYGIRVSDAEALRFKTVKNLFDFVKQKLLS